MTNLVELERKWHATIDAQNAKGEKGIDIGKDDPDHIRMIEAEHAILSTHATTPEDICVQLRVMKYKATHFTLEDEDAAMIQRVADDVQALLIGEAA